MATAVLSTSRALAEARKFIGRVPAIKLAELGGGQDAPFEGAFANLAHAFLRDKAPRLMEFELGFQLMEKSQDATRAVGVFGFKVGNQTLLAPVFFLNGDLKGHELLYIKNQDSFVPLKENWVNELLSKKPSGMGEGVDRNMSRIGVMSPSLYQLSRSPYKAASTEPAREELPGNWFDDCLPDLAYFAVKSAETDTKFADIPDLPTFLKQAGAQAGRTFLRLCQATPTLWQDTERFYGEGSVERMVRDSLAAGTVNHDSFRTKRAEWPGTSLQEPEVDPRTQVKVAKAREVLQSGGPDIRDLSDDEKKYLLKGRYVVRDGRAAKDISHVFDANTTLNVQNPSETGIYQVLVRPDTFRNCLVVMAPLSDDGGKPFCTVVDLETRRWKNIHPPRVFVKGEMSGDGWNKWFDKLPEADSGAGDDPRIILTASGQGTCPLTIQERRSSSADKPTRSYRVSYYDYGDEKGHVHNIRRQPDYFSGYSLSCGGPRLRFTDMPGHQVVCRPNREMQVPVGARMLRLKKPYTYNEDGSRDEPLEPGSLVDIQAMIFDHTKPLTIFTRGEEYRVNRGKAQDKEACILELITQHGLREKAAAALVEKVEQKPGDLHSFRVLYAPAYDPDRVKKADTANLVSSAPSAPAWLEPRRGSEPTLGGSVPIEFPMNQAQLVPDMSSARTDRSKQDPRIQPDHLALRFVQQAAQSGQKHVFDTAVFNGMLRSERDDSMVDRYFGVMMKCLDRLGRILFNYYWHQEAFAERYGKADMSALEDSIRNTFESLGDLLLDLKARKVGGFVDDGIAPENDLDE